MRDQPRAVALRGLRDAAGVTVTGGKQWNVMLPGFTAKGGEIRLDRRRAVEPVIREGSDAGCFAMASKTLFHRPIGRQQISQQQDVAVATARCRAVGRE